MVKDFDAHLHKFLRPSSKIPDFKTFPEHRPWPVLYWEMIQYDKKYLSYMLHNMKTAAAETVSITETADEYYSAVLRQLNQEILGLFYMHASSWGFSMYIGGRW